ncbi:putative cytochrome P450 [Xylariales sp. PMI_506]|nr:putative cytochrome P450 [Xylariales sp. PMI_506]
MFALLVIPVIGVCYYVGLVIYRLTFHPLAKFPGPWMAAASGWYDFYYDIYLGGQFYRNVQRLHDKYGPIVRVSPDELHIRDSSYYSTIYAPATKKQDKSPRHVRQVVTPTATFSTVQHELHRVRRDAMNPFFSKRSIAERAEIIKNKAEILCRRFEEFSSSGQIVTLNFAYAALTIDVITHFCFGKSVDHLGHPDFNAAWSKVLYGLNFNGKLAQHFSWSREVQTAIPNMLRLYLDPKLIAIAQYLEFIKKQTGSVLLKYNSGEKLNDNIFQAILDSNLSPDEKSPVRLVHEALILVGAGTETTAATLAVATFYLLSNPDKLGRVQRELASVIEADLSFDLLKLEKLPYLNACISEALRVSPGVTSRVPRVPREPLIYDQWTIPAGTIVSQLNYLVNHDSENFPQPEKFRPERWIEADAQGIHLDKYLASFSKGSRNCVGINLAWAELRLTLAYVLSRFQMQLFQTTEEDDVVLDRDIFFGRPKASSQGIRVTVTKV